MSKVTTNSKIKIAYFDIDWTIYDHQNNHWDYPTLEAIKKLRKNGVKVVFCTARNYQSATRFGIKELGINWDAEIYCAGALIIMNEKMTTIGAFSNDDVASFIEECEKLGSTFEIVCPKSMILIGEKTEGFNRYYKDFKETPPSRHSFDFNSDVALGFNFFDVVEKEEKLKKRFPDFVYYRYHEFAVDITPVPHVKGQAMEIINKKFGLNKDEAISFGDGDQDLTMKMASSPFVAVGNADEMVKKEADLVTDSVMESGVKKALEQLKLI